MSEPEQVVFTMNATHGLNLAIRSLLPRGKRALISGFEHNAVTRPLHALGAELRIAGRRLFDPADTLRDFERLLPGGAGGLHPGLQRLRLYPADGGDRGALPQARACR